MSTFNFQMQIRDGAKSDGAVDEKDLIQLLIDIGRINEKLEHPIAIIPSSVVL